MKVNFAHLCDYASISVEGKMSLMGVFGRIYTGKIPAVHIQAFLAFEIELDYTEVGYPVAIRVECVDADGNKILSAQTTIQVPGEPGGGKIGEHPTLPQIMRLPPMQFTKEGNHEINIFLGAEGGAHHVPFEVVILQAAPPPSTTE